MNNGMIQDIILIVDDDGANLMLAHKILGKDYHVAAAKSGIAALQYLERNVPALVLLDIKMPDMDGFETLRRMREIRRLQSVPVIFLTGDKDPETEKRCFQAGAMDFVTKPFVSDVLLSRVERTLELEQYRKDLENVVEEQTQLLAERTDRISRMQDSVIVGMANLIENRDGSTGEHVKNTQIYVRMIVERLRRKKLFPNQLDEAEAVNIIKAAPLHDIGKIRISDSILLKPGKLSAEEYGLMKQHAVYGLEVIQDIIADVEDEAYICTAGEIALCHHERWDGSGYPRGLSGDVIPLGARIMAVADVFDALYAERCYKKPVRPVEKAMEIMLEGRGTQFDAVILDTFVELMPEIKQFLGEVQEDV